jgi:hypothetical protein
LARERFREIACQRVPDRLAARLILAARLTKRYLSAREAVGESEREANVASWKLKE